jgi:DNA-binding NtrC family response regulator
MSDIAELLQQSLPDIVALLERKRRENEKALIEAICKDAAAGVSVRTSAQKLGCDRQKVYRLRKKVRV